MNKSCCKSSGCSKGSFKEVTIAIDALAPELNQIQRHVMTQVVEKVLKGSCKGKCEACKDGCQCCDKCQCGCRDNKPQSCCKDKGKESCRECKDGCRCCDKCQCGCRDKGTCCKGKCENDPKGCPSQCCDKCQCGCQTKDNCCKKGCKCCSRCKCGCNDNKQQEGCCKGGCKCCDKCKCGCRDASGCCKDDCCKGGCECCEKCECGCRDSKGCDAGGKCCGECKCGCKEGGEVGCGMEELKATVGKLLGSGKEKTLQMMKIAFDAYAKVEKRPLESSVNLPCKFARKFSKKVSKLLCKMIEKSKGVKEVQEKMAEKFWEKISDKCLKKTLKKGKELASKLLFYKGNVCEEVVCKGIIKAASQALCIAVAKRDSSGSFEEERKSVGEENVKGRGKKSKGGFAAKFISQFIDNNSKDALASSKAIKEPIEKFLRETVSPCCIEKFKAKIIPKVISNALLIPKTGKNDEFYVELANNYMKSLCFCDKKCVKSCTKLAKAGLLFSGMKEKCKIHVAAHWAAVMCCKVNGKIGCPKESCVEFLGKWIKDFAPVVEEGFKVLEEVKEKLKGDEHVAAGRKMDKVYRRILLEYLKLYCIDGKLNKDDFKAQASSILTKPK